VRGNNTKGCIKILKGRRTGTVTYEVKNKKLCFVFYIAGERKKKIIYDVIVKQKIKNGPLFTTCVDVC